MESSSDASSRAADDGAAGPAAPAVAFRVDGEDTGAAAGVNAAALDRLAARAQGLAEGGGWQEEAEAEAEAEGGEEHQRRMQHLQGLRVRREREVADLKARLERVGVAVEAAGGAPTPPPRRRPSPPGSAPLSPEEQSQEELLALLERCNRIEEALAEAEARSKEAHASSSNSPPPAAAPAGPPPRAFTAPAYRPSTVRRLARARAALGSPSPYAPGPRAAPPEPLALLEAAAAVLRSSPPGERDSGKKKNKKRRPARPAPAPPAFSPQRFSSAQTLRAMNREMLSQRKAEEKRRNQERVKGQKELKAEKAKAARYKRELERLQTMYMLQEAELKQVKAALKARDKKHRAVVLGLERKLDALERVQARAREKSEVALETAHEERTELFGLLNATLGRLETVDTIAKQAASSTATVQRAMQSLEQEHRTAMKPSPFHGVFDEDGLADARVDLIGRFAGIGEATHTASKEAAISHLRAMVEGA